LRHETSQMFVHLIREAVTCLPLIGVADRSVNRRHIRLAQAGSRFDEGLQHRLKIESRATDDLKHVGGGCLLLQRFAQLVN
jgi:hypothetical protein